MTSAVIHSQLYSVVETCLGAELIHTLSSFITGISPWQWQCSICTRMKGSKCENQCWRACPLLTLLYQAMWNTVRILDLIKGYMPLYKTHCLKFWPFWKWVSFQVHCHSVECQNHVSVCQWTQLSKKATFMSLFQLCPKYVICTSTNQQMEDHGDGQVIKWPLS